MELSDLGIIVSLALGIYNTILLRKKAKSIDSNSDKLKGSEK